MPRKAEQKFTKVYRRTQPAASRNLQRAYVMTSSRPRTYAVRGRGGYWQNVKSRWAEGGGPRKGLFEQAGNILGGPIGGQAGGLINRALYALTGFGDYTVKKTYSWKKPMVLLLSSIGATRSSLFATESISKISMQIPLPLLTCPVTSVCCLTPSIQEIQLHSLGYPQLLINSNNTVSKAWCSNTRVCTQMPS